MLKKRLCEAVFDWDLACEGPLLVADGRYEKEKKQEKDPDKVFVSRAQKTRVVEAVRSVRGSGLPLELPFYVPGTSLRGPVRSRAELIIRSLAPDGAASPRTACDPFETDKDKSKSCSTRMDERQPEVPYEQACPACKLFGCTGTASRVEIADADFKNHKSVFRDMIGIDRFTGGVHKGGIDPATGGRRGGANMRFHVLEKTSFSTTVTVRNFELWHLGLLAYVFQDFADTLVSVGFGKSKGFGKVTGEVTSVTLTYPAGRAKGRLEHLGSLAKEERDRYGFHSVDAPECSLEPVQRGGLALYERFHVADLPTLWARAAGAFNDFMTDRFKEAA